MNLSHSYQHITIIYFYTSHGFVIFSHRSWRPLFPSLEFLQQTLKCSWVGSQHEKNRSYQQNLKRSWFNLRLNLTNLRKIIQNSLLNQTQWGDCSSRLQTFLGWKFNDKGQGLNHCSEANIKLVQDYMEGGHKFERTVLDVYSFGILWI